MERLVEGVYADSSKSSTASKLKTAETMIGRWGLEPYPPTVEKVLALGATLIEGYYLSAATYVSAYKVAAERQGLEWHQDLGRVVKDVVRSCERGREPRVKRYRCRWTDCTSCLETGMNGQLKPLW